jgi:uncharacterized membrane protein
MNITPSESSSEAGETCRICLEPGGLIQPCNCTGTTAHVHKECLETWLKTSNRTNCEICLFEYEIVRVRATACDFRRRNFVFSEFPDIDRSIKVVGFFGMLPTPALAHYWGLVPFDIYFVSNLVWLVTSLTFMQRMHILPTITFWKYCSCVGSLSVSMVTGVWVYTFIDSCVGFLSLVLCCLCLCLRASDVQIEESHDVNIENISNGVETKNDNIVGQSVGNV